MTRPVNTKFNRRTLPVTGEKRKYTCMSCRRVRTWTQVGDLPERCLACARLHNTDMNMGRDTNRPWAVEMAAGATLNERLDSILHWSPELNRWMYFDGNRWIRGTEVDAHGVVKAVLGSLGRFHKLTGPESTRMIEAEMETFRLWIIARANGST